MKRLDYKAVHPATYKALLALQEQVRSASLEPRLVDLVYLRVSQLNGCAFCVDMHDKDLRAAGETPERLALLALFREAPSFSARERAALAYAEALTTLRAGGVPDDVYADALRELGEQGVVELTLAITTIQAWNRFNIAFRTPAGGYVARAR